MTAPAPEAKRLLDQLQNEVNRVLEQTGRLFAVARVNGFVPPAAQASRLKQVLPDCIDKFHSALDELEDELQTAKIVLRRDLALLQAKNGSFQPSNNVNAGDVTVAAMPDVTMSDDSKAAEAALEDTEMTDEQPTGTQLEPNTAPSPQAAAAEEGSATAPRGEPGEQAAGHSTEPPNETKHLSLDTSQTPPKSGEDNQADTGTASNNADLDSLFGGSAAASTTNEAGNDAFNTDTANGNDADDFDFEAFTNELNTDSQEDGAGGSGDPEFDAIFGDNNNDAQDNNGQGNVDDIFGDLLADFPSEGYNNQGDDNDFDFDFS